MSGTKPGWRLVLASCIHGFLGYNSAFFVYGLNNLEPFIKNFTANSLRNSYNIQLSHNGLTWLWALLSASVVIGALLFSFAIGFPLERFGMKPTIMILKNVVQILACLMAYFSIIYESVVIFFISSFISGYALILCNLIPVYLTECAPNEIRGKIAVISSLGYPFFILLSTVFGLRQVLGSADLWPYYFLVPALFSFIHMLLYPFFPNSPKYLYITKEQVEKARQSVLFYHGQNTDIEQIFEEYKREDEVTRSLKTIGYWEILRTRHLAWPFWLCTVTSIATAAGSIDIISSYSTELLKNLDISDKMAPIFTLIFTQIPAILATVCGIFLIEKVGRRPIMLGGMFGDILTNVLLFFAFFYRSNFAGIILMLISMVFSNVSINLGPQSLLGILTGELPPQASRPRTATFSAGYAWNIPSLIIILFFPPLYRGIGAYSVLPLLIMSIIIFIFFYRYLPETKGRPVDEIVKIWKRDDDENEDNQLIENRSISSDGHGTIELIKRNR